MGDVHLGRKFVEFVPLHRRGHRERMVMADFKAKLAECTSNLFVQVGDLFDAFVVDEAVVLEAALAVREEAKKNPQRYYVFYRGNHDASKDANRASSFDVFAELMHGFNRVYVMKTPEVLYLPSNQMFGFIPWSPWKSSTELAYDLLEYARPLMQTKGVEKLDTVFGHWDVDSFGGDDRNLVPTAMLSKITSKIVTGHVHTPTAFVRDGVEVTVTGSMQPYSHGEDPVGLYYKTIPFETYQNYGPTELGWCRNLNLRILVKDGEEPEPCDCLSFRTKKVTEKAEADEAADLDVRIEDFNMDNLFRETLNGREVKASVQDQIMDKWQELKNA
jgi:DNA repair exonuclease SbcCD nuclease subunit